MDSEDRLLTIPDLASYLQVAEKTVLRMVRNSEIPGVKIGNQWRFPKQIIDDWILSKMKVVPKNDLSKLMLQSKDLVPLSRFVESRHIIMNLEPGTKEEVLSQLISPLVEEGLVTDAKDYVSLLLDREQLMTTAIGDIAFPHARNPHKNPSDNPCVVIGICRQGTKFDAAEGVLTKLFLMPVTDSEVVHLRLMSKMASLLRIEGAVQKLVSCTSPDEVIGRLISLEQGTD